MIRIAIFRHAKSDWDSDAASDFDRPLAPRGRIAAPAMGNYIRSNLSVPDLVYCSTALRTRQTFSLAFPNSERQPTVLYKDKLYLAEPNQILQMARSTDLNSGSPESASGTDQVKQIMFIGHNPGMQAFALGMIGKMSENIRVRDAIKRIKRKLPTAAFVLIEFDTNNWSELEPRTGILQDYMTPKLLSEIVSPS